MPALSLCSYRSHRQRSNKDSSSSASSQTDSSCTRSSKSPCLQAKTLPSPCLFSQPTSPLMGRPPR
ncbi:nuclear transcription factor-Y gamma, isoform CRA_a [Rattus norvegicus]|uniref:Nuclear transcription factor-Y gamma, isoform CRA_a n=1 Tax=Rattus norvegicus TaxID=10116 RepID=A6IRZ5_RAT|nr:nuclear transcription factor-Y gamma, isoform CRA_a [Rattus norvegicus]